MSGRKIGSYILILFTLFLFMPLNVSADIGPKPSVTVEITGAKEEVLYYATLLSERESTGPASAYDGGFPAIKRGEEGRDIWEKFVAYEDTDGYYFLQEFWECSGNDKFRWGYYPPNPFKILLYFPETDSFVVSGIYERYAFDTYYIVDLNELVSEDTSGITVGESGVNGVRGILIAEKNYDYTWESISLVVRILLTVLIEVCLALLFGFRRKNQLKVLVSVNAATQIVLNVLLNIVNYNKGAYAFVFYYVLWELLVFVVEAIIYAAVLAKPEFGKVSKGKAVLYALVANAVSFALGLVSAHLIPGIF